MCLTFVLPAIAWGQDIYQKKEIAIFTLSHEGVSVPSELPASLDEEIRSVFVNLGRFTVIGMKNRLSAKDVDQFIENIKTYKEQNAVIPDKVQMGQEYFTQADLNKLIASFIVVIPYVVSYDKQTNDSGNYDVKLSTAFSIINVETTQSIGQFTVDTEGTAAKLADAWKNAVDALPTFLDYQIRKISDFQITSGIVEVHGSDVIFQLGKNVGILPGDYYQVVEPRVLSSGQQVTEEKALLLVRQVEDEVSYATVIYANSPLAMGDQIREVPMVGFEAAGYMRAVVLGGGGGDLPPVLLGTRATASRGFYGFRPFAEVETPIQLLGYTVDSFPFEVSLGGEYDLILGRLMVAPWASLGVGFNVDVVTQTDVEMSRFGGSVGVGISYLFNSTMRVSVEGGYLTWVSSNPYYGESFGGVFAGAAFSFNF